jgi:hypothetical protein
MTHLDDGTAGQQQTQLVLCDNALQLATDDRVTKNPHEVTCPGCAKKWLQIEAKRIELVLGKPLAITALDKRGGRIAFLERKKAATKADLLMKFEDGDWRGVQDCGSDLRDIVSELAGLRY